MCIRDRDKSVWTHFKKRDITKRWYHKKVISQKRDITKTWYHKNQKRDITLISRFKYLDVIFFFTTHWPTNNNNNQTTTKQLSNNHHQNFDFKFWSKFEVKVLLNQGIRASRSLMKPIFDTKFDQNLKSKFLLNQDLRGLQKPYETHFWHQILTKIWRQIFAQPGSKRPPEASWNQFLTPNFDQNLKSNFCSTRV